MYEIFAALDRNGDGLISHAEFIHGLKDNPWAAAKLGTLCARACVRACVLCVCVYHIEDSIKLVVYIEHLFACA